LLSKLVNSFFLLLVVVASNFENLLFNLPLPLLELEDLRSDVCKFLRILGDLLFNLLHLLFLLLSNFIVSFELLSLASQLIKLNRNRVDVHLGLVSV
jgi:hypothetical protein